MMKSMDDNSVSESVSDAFAGAGCGPMRYLCDFFEHADAYVHAADIDSHDIVYINRKLKEAMGICPGDEAIVRKCYQAFYDNPGPCVFCNNGMLQQGKFLVQDRYSNVLKRFTRRFVTRVDENGRRYRFEIGQAAEGSEEAWRGLNRQAELEARVNEAIRDALCEPDPDRSIAIILEFLGTTLRGERAYIFERNSLGGDDNTYEWTAPGIVPQKDRLQNLPPDICAVWYRHFGENRNVIFDDIGKMRHADPLQYENLKSQDIRSIVVVPFYNDSGIGGFYGVDNPPGQSLDYALNMLQIMGYFISSILKRRDMMSQLRRMSFCDQLTGLGNRHALREYMAGMADSSSLGIVYCDITGLKRTNDQEGHASGDRLICKAAESLRSVFGSYGLFRIGGDEMLAVCIGIDRAELDALAMRLKETAKRNSVNLAVGAAWNENYENNLQKLLNEAEELMYRAKSEYYRAAGIDRRR